jgi:hypothetical protein
MDKPKDPELRDCVVTLRDDHEVEHSVRLRATSVYEAALRGLAKLQKVGWESDGSQVRTVVVENLRRADDAYGQRQENA